MSTGSLLFRAALGAALHLTGRDRRRVRRAPTGAARVRGGAGAGIVVRHLIGHFGEDGSNRAFSGLYGVCRPNHAVS
ncbi:hypothetical protein V2I01_35835 [Micromonospora sp. BRA006-A]|nr:hypothetical protein [Micromonospora sp. BRA006-A]